MKKFFDREPVWFAVLWIGIYVLAFGNADMMSEAIGVPKLLTVCVGFVLSGILLAFVGRHRLWDSMGLCRFKGSGKSFLYFLPLVIISSVNLWNGLTLNADIPASILSVLSMCFVGFLEELIFRGFLFGGMSRDNVKSAVIVSSVSFGLGHAVNLLLGAPLFETLLQLIYASAIGFCYTAVYYVGGSIIPCIISHAVVNSLSVFAREPSQGFQLVVALVQTGLGLSYGAWLFSRARKDPEICSKPETI